MILGLLDEAQAAGARLAPACCYAALYPGRPGPFRVAFREGKGSGSMQFPLAERA